jgi:hypothetical protein
MPVTTRSVSTDLSFIVKVPSLSAGRAVPRAVTCCYFGMRLADHVVLVLFECMQMLKLRPVLSELALRVGYGEPAE